MLARPEIGSKEHISLWLDSKDPNEEYNWSNVRGCACGQYSRANGSISWITSTWVNQLNVAASERPHNFGALAKRWAAIAE
jgi:hypothetical protein